MMIYFDVTKAGRGAHHSGLMRVSTRLRKELGAAAVPVEWREGGWHHTDGGRSLTPRPEDWVLTAELFSEPERSGFSSWVGRRTCRWAAIFHDAIPLKLPQITWPQSVARHPGYMKLLAQSDRVWAVSAASRAELLGYWQWLDLGNPPAVEVLALGADFDASGRKAAASKPAPLLLCVGILEPRKNQEFLLEVATALWREGLAFDLHLVGRVNPHFGRPLAQKIGRWRREFPGLHHHAGADDAALAALYARTRATVFPTRAEGCGLPLLESLWRGVPCVASDLPVLRENADGGGCVLAGLNDGPAWRDALRRILTDDAHHATLAREASGRELPTWAGAAATVRAGLMG